MKKLLCLSFALLMSSSAMAEESWWNSLLNSIGLGEEVEEPQNVEASAAQPDIMGLITHLTNNLNVDQEQAQGGVASLMNYAKQNLTQENFSALATQLPGTEGILSELPDISNIEQGGLGGLLDKAAQYNESLASVNDLKKQFDALGLDTGMIMGFVEQAQSYLDTPAGQEAKKLLMDSFTSLQL
jgi:hypothetical protein